MKKFIVFAAACLVACSFFLTVQPASASLGTADTSWAQYTDENTFYVNLSGVYGEPIAFGIFESGNIDNYTQISGMSLSVIMTITDHVVYIDGAATGLTLSESDTFGLYFGDWASKDTNYEITGITNNWSLDFNNDSKIDIQVNNANPVPIPTAVFLLGSGLVGLAGFKRRNR